MPLVPCVGCKNDVDLTHEECRRLADEDRSVTCPKCAATERTVRITAVMRPPSKQDKMLAILGDLESQGVSQIYWRGLTKIAWETDREAFGLKPFAAEHPDSNLVMVLLVNMRVRGLIEWVGKNTGVCRMTAKGRGELAARRALALAKGA